ncbi:MAG: ATP-binding protein [Lautropia sp.]
MAVIQTARLELASEQDIVRARQAVRKLAQEHRFGVVDQTKLVTAASELARNAVVYGGGGFVEIELLTEDGRRGMRLRFVDDGPGIADVGLAMTDGWTSGKGLGLGLSGAKRLSSEFELDSAPGRGTRVTIARWI